MTRPMALPVLQAGVPEMVKAFPQWVLWRYERQGSRWAKPPYQPNGKRADKTNPAHWSEFSEVMAAYEEGGYDGIGFCVTGEDPFTFIDLDHCINEQETGKEAREILALIDSYTELSPSGTGLRIITRGQVPANIKRRGVEIYNRAWYLTITGQVYGNRKEIAERQEQLDRLIARYDAPPVETHVATTAGLQEEDRAALQRIRNSRQGERFTRLFDGDLTGYASQSEADLALCSILAFWTKNDQQAMDRIFRASGLYRPKWDTRHGNRTYGQRTMDRATAQTGEPLAPAGDDRKQMAREPAWEPSANIISAHNLLAMKLPPRQNLLDPWLPEQGLCLLHAYRGVGKTHVSLGIACAVATGSSFLGWEAKEPQGVLFIDGEMPAVTIQERLRHTLATMDITRAHNLQIITPDLQQGGMPDLGTRQGQAQVDAVLTENIKLIIVDNISTVCRSTLENKSDSWLPVQEWALRMRGQGKSVLLVHHDGKGGQQRGSSRKEDVLDTVIQLVRPNHYTPDQGAVFEVHFRKNRGIHGEDAKPFEARLTSTDGAFHWQTRTLEESNLDKVAMLLEQGYRQKEIAEELNLSKGYTSKLIKKIKNQQP
ncbi:hypothetical protein GF1_11610 [Desulfolithobacter dissulfuricans]|uniref:AAA+ ATPase domain-containing protein n=1 Tax=Desulfolithobacter dissulfuricans TaxID=2795293 RepID=A0A915XI48_9BACT|nr:AAA family ATPase [Desulfolithobacter dissulfuricans]BCO08785.1 hypothetical protein GF1_11610 [Desulfolithobacter dissulfuricans]